MHPIMLMEAVNDERQEKEIWQNSQVSGQSRLLHTMTKESVRPGKYLCDELCPGSASPRFCVTARGQEEGVDEVTPTMCGVVLTTESTRDGGLEGSGGSSR